MIPFSAADDPVAQVIRSRRTINDFLPESPPLEPVLQSLDLARWAPNHKLTEPWTFHLLGPETKQRMLRQCIELLTKERGEEFAQKKCARWAGIPGWIVVTCRKSADPLRAEEDYAAVCCAIQNLMLALWSHEIGTKWSTSAILQSPEISQLLGIDPEVSRVVGLVWYGYPAVLPDSRRAPISEIVTLLP